MNTIDLRPFYRTARELDRLAGRFVNSVQAVDNAPAYDIVETGSDQYAVVIALPGWKPEELTIGLENGTLTIKGEPAQEQNGPRVIHRGIARHVFERRFALAEYVEVRGASFENGLLRVELVREVPEALKPRVIAINNGHGSEPTAKAA